MASIRSFVRREPVLVIAALAAVVSCFFVPPDKAYFSYFDLRTLARLTVRGGWPGNLDADDAALSLLPSEYLNAVIDDDVNRIDDAGSFPGHIGRLTVLNVADETHGRGY